MASCSESPAPVSKGPRQPPQRPSAGARRSNICTVLAIWATDSHDDLNIRRQDVGVQLETAQRGAAPGKSSLLSESMARAPQLYLRRRRNRKVHKGCLPGTAGKLARGGRISPSPGLVKVDTHDAWWKAIKISGPLLEPRRPSVRQSEYLTHYENRPRASRIPLARDVGGGSVSSAAELQRHVDASTAKFSTMD